MRAILFFPLAAFALSLSSCTDDADEVTTTCPEGHRETAIFVDRSASATADETTRLAFEAAMLSAVDSTLMCAGDAVKTFLLHRETDGKAYADRFESRVDNEDLSELSSGSAESERTAYRTAIRRERENALRRSHYMADSTEVPRDLQLHTDLLGMLPVVAEELRAGEGVVRRVVVLSDLNESMTGPGRRDFDRQPPASQEEARAWATADVALVQREYGVGTDVLTGVEIVPVLGTLASKPSATAVKAYWQTLWAAFGATDVRW